MRLRPPRPFGVRLGVEWLLQPDLPVSTGALEIQRVPTVLAGGWSLRRRGLEVDLEGAVLLEIILARSRDIAEPASTTQLATRAVPGASVGRAMLAGWKTVTAAGA